MAFDFTTYQQQAVTTAPPTELDMQYLAPALVGKLGELFTLQARAHRDTWPRWRLEDDTVARLGGALRLVALISHVTDTALLTDRYAEFTRADLSGGMMTATAMIYGPARPLGLTHLLAVINHEANEHGTTLEAVAELDHAVRARRTPLTWQNPDPRR